MPDARDGALADPAAVGAARAPRPGAPTASARTSTSRRRGGSSATRSPRRPGSIRRPTRGCPSGRSGRCWRSSTQCLASRGCALLADAPAAAEPRGARASPPCATWPSCSTATRCTGRSWSARGRADGGGDDALAGRAVAAPATRGSPSPARPSGSSAPARGCARSPRSPTCPSGSSLFGLTRLPAGHLRRARGARRSAATSTSSCCTPRRRCGSGRREAPSGRASARDDDPTATLPANRAARLLGAGLARDAARARPARRARRPPPPRRARRRHAARPHPGRRARRPPPPGAPLPATPTAALLDAGDRSVAGPRLPRPRAPGRGPARRDPAPARRGPDARAARRDRDVPGHRDVRAADPGHVRRRRGRRARTTSRDAGRARPPDLRVRLADRSLRQTNPVLGVVARLLELADERLTASQVLDLADREPVRRRFRPRRRRPRAARGVGRRRAASAGGSTPSTARRSSSTSSPAAPGARGWTALLLGVTMTEDEQRLFAGVLPLDDVESGAIDLAGRFAELVDRLAAARRRAQRARSRSSAWAAAIASAADALTATGAARRLAARASCSGSSTTSSREAAGTRGATLDAGRGPRAARRAPAGPPDARELPHRPPDRLHARADALGAAPGRLPARPRRRRRSRARRRATATT